MDKNNNSKITANPAETPYGIRSFPDESTLNGNLKKQLGPEFLSERAGPGGMKVPYIEGSAAVELANEVFNFNGWSNEIKNQQLDFVDCVDGKYSVCVSTTVRITLQDGAYREDTGCGLCENLKTKGGAIEKAKKSSVTDAIKRTLRLFGNGMGGCISSKPYMKNIKRIPAPSAVPFVAENLLRHPGYITGPRPPLADSASKNNNDKNNLNSYCGDAVKVATHNPNQKPNLNQNQHQTKPPTNQPHLQLPQTNSDHNQVPPRQTQNLVAPTSIPLQPVDDFDDDGDMADFADINMENYDDDNFPTALIAPKQPIGNKPAVAMHNQAANEPAGMRRSVTSPSIVAKNPPVPVVNIRVPAQNSHQPNHFIPQSMPKSSGEFQQIPPTPDNHQASNQLAGEKKRGDVLNSEWGWLPVNHKVALNHIQPSTNMPPPIAAPVYIPNKQFQQHQNGQSAPSTGNMPPRKGNHQPIKVSMNRNGVRPTSSRGASVDMSRAGGGQYTSVSNVPSKRLHTDR